MLLSRRQILSFATVVLASGALAGCAGVGEKISSIDWEDPGNVGPSAMDGSELSASVVDALAAAPMTMNEQLKVGLLRDNRIRLSGYASSSSAASEALRLTREVTGVSDVLDTISVR